jgi:hypothetical protein
MTALLTSACAVALLIPASAAAAAAAGRCRGIALPTLGHQYTELTGGDPTGKYQAGWGRSGTDTFDFDAIVWTGRQPQRLNTDSLLPYVNVAATGVNRHGVSIGFRTIDNSSFHTDAWLYHDGRFTMLPGLSTADATSPMAINSHGDVVGINLAETAPVWHGVVWPADRPGTVRELTIPRQSDAWIFADGIDEDGTVLGHLGGRPGETPYIWPVRGNPYPLNAPQGVGLAGAYAIRNGWVVGYGQRGDQLVGLRWNLRGRTVEVTSTEYPVSLSVNRWGAVGAVGALIHSDGRVAPLGGDARPVVVTDGGTAAGMSESYGVPTLWTGC